MIGFVVATDYSRHSLQRLQGTLFLVVMSGVEGQRGVPSVRPSQNQTERQRRGMKARGKREARRPWKRQSNLLEPWKGEIVWVYFGLSGLGVLCGVSFPGATRFALAPGCYIPRRWRLARLLCKATIIFEAQGCRCAPTLGYRK